MSRETWESLCIWLKLAGGSAAAAASLAWGSLPALVQALVALMALDLLTGLLAGYVTRALSSTTSFRGLAKKALVLLLVGTGAVLAPAVGLPLAPIIAGFYAVHEGLSIIENAARAGLPVPQALKAALAKLSTEAEAEAEAAAARRQTHG